MLTEYYKSTFGTKVTPLFEQVKNLDESFKSLADSLPKKIVIREELTGKVFVLDLHEDTTMSPYEYMLLSSVFHGYVNQQEGIYSIIFSLPSGEKYSFEDYVGNFPGIHKLLRSVLFLDFYNSLDFINFFCAFYYLVPVFGLRKIPSSGHKDHMVAIKSDLLHKESELRNQYDSMSLKYSEYSTNIDALKNIIGKIEVDMNLSEALPDRDSSRMSKYEKRINRLGKVISSVDKRLVSLKEKDINLTHLLQSKEINKPEDYELKVRVAKRRKEYTSLKTLLVNTQSSFMSEIENMFFSEKEAIHLEENRDRDESHYNDIKEKLLVQESKRSTLHTYLSNLKTEINSVRQSILDVESQMTSNFKPVDLDRIIAENVITLDKDVSLVEKLVRFTYSYFSDLEPKTFLTFPERRDLLRRIFGELRIKSLSPTLSLDPSEFITVG